MTTFDKEELVKEIKEWVEKERKPHKQDEGAGYMIVNVFNKPLDDLLSYLEKLNIKK